MTNTTDDAVEEGAMTDSALGSLMQEVRATQWYVGMFGDPYALVLRAQTDDPTPFYDDARARGPLHQNMLGTWVCADHALGARILADDRFGTRLADGTPPPQHLLPLDGSYLDLERADRDRLRLRAEPLLGTEAVERYRPLVARVGAEILDWIDTAAPFDLVGDFADPLATGVLAELFAVPTTDRDRFAAWCGALGPVLDAQLCPQRLAPARAMVTALGELGRYLTGLIEGRAAAPGDDLISGLLGTPGEDRERDVLATAVLLTVTGTRIATKTMCGAALALATDPEAQERLRDGSGTVADALREALRYDPPVHLRSLVAHTDVDIEGQRIPAGGHTVVLVGAANRDSRVYPDAAGFDPRRFGGPAPLLADGPFPEFASPFALLQAEAGLSALLARPGLLRPAGPVVRHRRAPVSRAIAQASVTVG